MRYTHLTQNERYQIHILRKAGHNQSEIARMLARSKSTISRELKRHCGQRGYRPKQAQELSLARMRARDNGRRIAAATWDFVDSKLAQQWSPEQICGYRKVNDMPSVSHESIYQRIYADKRAGGRLHVHLRCQKKRKKRYAGQQQALVTLNERQSRYTLIGKVARKTAQAVSDTIITLLTPFSSWVHTLTTDNGKEFSQHERVAESIETQFYFAHPYCSWERGANENMNGLIRQFFPKKMSFDQISDSNIEAVMDNLNSRPRKCLGFKTPNDVFMQQLQSN
jgi:transposase, IS30 family